MSTLGAGTEIHIIACVREFATPGSLNQVWGLRWASRPDLGFPADGYNISWLSPSTANTPVHIGTYTLPETTDWAVFAAEAEARRPVSGPYFTAINESELGFLLPLVRFADPRTAETEWAGLTVDCAAVLGEIHRNDAELAWKYWGSDPAPSLAEVLTGPAAAEAIDYYRGKTVDFLVALAWRFEYAVLLGLGTNFQHGPGNLTFRVEAEWESDSGTADSDAASSGLPCALAPPAWVTAAAVPGTVPHPAFADFPDVAASTVPRVPASFTALSWEPRAPGITLIDTGPYLYLVNRYWHGAGTAGDVQEPVLPSGAAFTPVIAGDYAIQPATQPHYLDLPGMAWPPLAGWYHYEVRSVSLLGVVSATGTLAAVRHYDTIAPPSPMARPAEERVVALEAGATRVEVQLVVDWSSAQDFMGPDAVEFRAAAQWTALESTSTHVETVADVSTGEPSDLLYADLTLTNLSGTANQYVGARLSLGGGDYPIVSHTLGAGAQMRVRRCRSQAPAAGSDAVIYSKGEPTELTRVAKLARSASATATVAAVVSADPLKVTLSRPLSDTSTRVYLHVLRVSLDAVQEDGGVWNLGVPASAFAVGALPGSAAIVYPSHNWTVNVAIPAGYTAGVLSLQVTAADGATYVDSPELAAVAPPLRHLKGNESGASPVVLSVRVSNPPGKPRRKPQPKGQRLWATSAASYAENSSYAVAWNAAAGAARYEVWRALEPAIPRAGPALTDAALVKLAAAHPEVFDLRSSEVFGLTYTDLLPGRAPTRAVYKVRGVGTGGEAGEFSEVIGPVWVPDVRQPAKPNLLRATAVKNVDRVTALEWTQAGPVDDVRFDIWCRGDDETAFRLAGSLVKGAATGRDGRYHFRHKERVPGRMYTYYVVAVREAADPIDPTGATLREIAGKASEQRATYARSSSFLAPSHLAVTLDRASGKPKLTWVNQDSYISIEVRRKWLGNLGYEVIVTLPGTAQSHTDATAAPGAWSYQLRALGISRRADTSTVEFTL